MSTHIPLSFRELLYQLYSQASVTDVWAPIPIRENSLWTIIENLLRDSSVSAMSKFLEVCNTSPDSLSAWCK